MRLFKKIWIAIVRLLRFFFRFRKPAFTVLEVNDWVVAEKPLALIGWQMRRRYSVFVAGTNFHNNHRSGLFLIALPEGLTEISVTIRSGWRKNVYRFSLKRISIPQEQLTAIIAGDLPVVESFRISVDLSLKTSWPLLSCSLPQLTRSVYPIRISSFYYHPTKPRL